MRVVAVVLNWNLPGDTIACAESLLAGDYADLGVLVVDNGSTDDSVARLRASLGNRVELLETGQNLLFAGGNNVGMRRALEQGAEWVLVLNNDTLVAPDMVSRLVQTAAQHPAAGGIAPMICLARAPDRIWSMGGRRRGWLGLPRNLEQGGRDHGQHQTPFEVDFVTGCAVLLRRAALERVGLFDERYVMYYEDADLSARLRAAGYTLVVEPRAKMWHAVSASAKARPEGSRYLGVRHRLRFYRQHTHGAQAVLTLALITCQELGRVLVDVGRGRRRLASAALRGLGDGWKDGRERRQAR
ncbi:MAG: glycosyltransferase family 2 protein [Anaerolineae bacterium]